MVLTNTSNYMVRLIEGTEMGSTWRYYFWKLLEWGYFPDWLIRMKIRSSLTQLVSGSYMPWHRGWLVKHHSKVFWAAMSSGAVENEQYCASLVHTIQNFGFHFMIS